MAWVKEKYSRPSEFNSLWANALIRTAGGTVGLFHMENLGVALHLTHPPGCRRRPVRHDVSTPLSLCTVYSTTDPIGRDDEARPPAGSKTGACEGSCGQKEASHTKKMTSSSSLALADAPKLIWLRILTPAFKRIPKCTIGRHPVVGCPKIPIPLRLSSSSIILTAYFDMTCDTSSFTSNNFSVSIGLVRDVPQLDMAYPQTAPEDRAFCGRWNQRDYELVLFPKSWPVATNA